MNPVLQEQGCKYTRKSAINTLLTRSLLIKNYKIINKSHELLDNNRKYVQNRVLESVLLINTLN